MIWKLTRTENCGDIWRANMLHFSCKTLIFRTQDGMSIIGNLIIQWKAFSFSRKEYTKGTDGDKFVVIGRSTKCLQQSLPPDRMAVAAFKSFFTLLIDFLCLLINLQRANLVCPMTLPFSVNVTCPMLNLLNPVTSILVSGPSFQCFPL